MSRSKAQLRKRRQVRLRKKISGTPERPRLSVFRSNSHIHAQVIDDVNGKTLCSASTLEASLKGKGGTSNSAAAAEVGKLIGERAATAGVKTVVFDRGGNSFHGRVAALADAARNVGLEF